MEEEEKLDVICSSQRVGGSHHQLQRKSYCSEFKCKQSLRYYISDGAAARSADDTTAGNIPKELSQLSNLNGLYLYSNNLSGKNSLWLCK